MIQTVSHSDQPAAPTPAGPSSLPGEGQPLISVDVVPLVLDREQQRLVVIAGDRLYEPHAGVPALPGVLLGHERVDDAAKRALETKIHASPTWSPRETRLTFLGDAGVFDNPDRDPRGPTLSIAKIATLGAVPEHESVHAIALGRFAPAAQPNGEAERVLPFDHDRIVQAAAEIASMRVWSDRRFAQGLLGGHFSTRDLLTVLRALAEVTGAGDPDPANAQRRLRGTGWVAQSKHPAPRVSAAAGRPPLMWHWI